jgi:ribosomal protein uL13
MVEKLFIDAENAVLGRMNSFVAKQALLGKEIYVLNCEKAVISGNKTVNIAHLKLKRSINSQKPRKGPFFSKDSEKIVKRAIRGMLPDWRNGRGKEAFKRIKCYNSIPEEFKKEKLIKIKTKLPPKIMSVQELSNKA